MFGDWLAAITERRRLGAVVTVATTEFTVEFLALVWPGIEAEFTRREIGSFPTTSGPDPALDAYDVIEWQRENLALVTNLPVRDLPLASVTQDRLPGIPLLAPSAGLIADFLRRWYGHDFRARLHIVAEIDSIYYGLALLRSRLVHGALISTSAAAQAAVEGRLSGGPGLRLVPLAPGFNPSLQILAGIFARKGERALYHPEHPLNLLWEAFDRYARSRS